MRPSPPMADAPSVPRRLARGAVVSCHCAGSTPERACWVGCAAAPRRALGLLRELGEGIEYGDGDAPLCARVLKRLCFIFLGHKPDLQ